MGCELDLAGCREQIFFFFVSIMFSIWDNSFLPVVLETTHYCTERSESNPPECDSSKPGAMSPGVSPASPNHSSIKELRD